METEKILFSKYHIIKVLKQSEKSRVMLVSHSLVGDRRIVKEILKDDEGCESILSEVNILKKLHFSGIPQIYDIEENEKYYYIIEQYVEGKTLYEYIEQEGRFTLEQAVRYTLKLAEIVKYLHHVTPYPVLHLDIQPKNIIISGKEVFLIDFGNATYVGSQGEKYYLKGTRGFAAPEQYDGNGISFATDIYSIGACLLYMVTAKFQDMEEENVSEEIQEILNGCMQKEITKRFADVDELCRKLQSYLHKNVVAEKKIKKEENIESGKKFQDYPQIISVAGVMGRVGTSYLALAFVSYLTRLGFRVSYEENNDSDMVRAFVRRNSAITYQNGYFYHSDCALKPKYNKNVSFSNQEEIIVRDEGVFSEEGVYSDFLILVAGVREWEAEALSDAEEILRKKLLLQKDMKAVWLFNLTNNRTKLPVMKYGMEQISISYLEEFYDERGSKTFERLKNSLTLKIG